MSSLKELMGSAYSDGMSIDDVKAFFEGNDKIVNLNHGGYVAKGKFDEANNKLKELTESTKDYADIKSKYDDLVAANEKNGQLDIIKKYVKPEYSEFVHYNLKKDNKINDAFEKNIQEYLKTNGQYAIESSSKEEGNKNQVIKTYQDMNGGTPNNKSTTNNNDDFNNAIRTLAGFK